MTAGERLRALAEEWFECCGDIHEPLSEAADHIDALEQALEGAIATLRLAHDRTLEARDSELFSSLRDTINKTCREAVAALRDRDRHPEGDEMRSSSVERSEIEPGPSEETASPIKSAHRVPGEGDGG